MRGFERGAVTVFDYFADDGASFARACDALVAAGFAVTDCSPARGSDFVRFGAARVTRPA